MKSTLYEATLIITLLDETDEGVPYPTSTIFQFDVESEGLDIKELVDYISEHKNIVHSDCWK